MLLRREQSHLPLLLSLGLGLTLLALIAGLAYGWLRIRQAGGVRCYAINRSSTYAIQTAKLTGRTLDCFGRECWIIARLDQPQRGVLCFFPKMISAPQRETGDSPPANHHRTHDKHQPFIAGRVAQRHTRLALNQPKHFA